ncbi:hypothetical protein D9623_31300 [Azospirillum brasilense]|nr:hypothetical protein D9623_31300 [Azospirillum brasilense]
MTVRPAKAQPPHPNPLPRGERGLKMRATRHRPEVRSDDRRFLGGFSWTPSWSGPVWRCRSWR